MIVKTYPVAYNAAGVLDSREAMPMRALFFERTDHALKRKSALVLDIIQGKTTVAEASRQYDPSPSEVEQWVDDGKRGMENALRANPQDVREQYERQFKDLQEAYGEAMLSWPSSV